MIFFSQFENGLQTDYSAFLTKLEERILQKMNDSDASEQTESEPCNLLLSLNGTNDASTEKTVQPHTNCVLPYNALISSLF